MTSDLNDTMRSLGSAAARLSRIVNGRRASLPPAAAAFNSARRIAQSIPPGHLIPRRVSDIQTGALAKKASAGFVERNRTPTKSVSAAVDTRAPTSKTK
jgi:hypothetical protein